MQNPITKAARYLRREYPTMSLMTIVGAGLGAGVATIASVATGTMFFMIPVMAVAMGGGMTLFSLPSGGEEDRPRGNTATVNGVKLVGDKRDVASIVMTQKLIDGLTKKMQHLPELPARTMNRIAAHILDIQDSLCRVRAYTEPAGDALTSFSFTRKMLDAKGQQIEHPVVTCNLPLSARPLPAAQAPAVIGAPPALASLPAPQADFTRAVEAPQPEASGNPAPTIKPELKL